MKEYPSMLYKDGDTAKEYKIAQNEAEREELKAQGFVPPGEEVRRRGRPPSNG